MLLTACGIPGVTCVPGAWSGIQPPTTLELSSDMIPTAPPSGPEGPPVRTSVVVSQVRYRPNCSGSGVRFIGLVEDTGTAPVRMVQVHATLQDASGAQVADSTADTLFILRPGKRFPFQVTVLLPAGPPSWSSSTVSVVGLPVKPPDGDSGAEFLDKSFVVVDSSVRLTPLGVGSYEVTGLIQNISTRNGDRLALLTTPTAVRIPYVSVALYDAAGNLVGMQDDLIESRTIAPGATGSFKIRNQYETAGPADHAVVQILP